MKKQISPIEIQWRSRSQANFLPPTDLKWTLFVTIVRMKTKHPNTEAEMILKALASHFDLFEFRLRFIDPKPSKLKPARRTIPN